MREILTEMEPVCQEEQTFVINFFHLTGKNASKSWDLFIIILKIDFWAAYPQLSSSLVFCAKSPNGSHDDEKVLFMPIFGL